MDPGPASAEQQPAWLKNMQLWRKKRLAEIGYRDAIYQRADLAWTRKVFNQEQLLVWDRGFFDAGQGSFNVDRALGEFESRFGPLDSVLVWPGYPNLGLDYRNQFDVVRDLPGGLPALRKVVEDFHRHGTRVLFPVVVWDQGTRDEGVSQAVALTKLLRDVGADGVNFDTINRVPVSFRAAAAAAGEPQPALEPQFDPQNDSLSFSAISWSDWVVWETLVTPTAPRLSRVKWLEPRHMVEVTDRYARVKTDSIQNAFFNGQGYALLENMWGFWYGASPRDAEALRRCARIERAFPENLASAAWEPYTALLQRDVFGSRFPLGGRTLWTLVNRNEYDVDGEQLAVPAAAGMHYYDLWHGAELKPVIRGTTAYLSFPMESLGFGAVLADAAPAPDAALAGLLAATAKDATAPLKTFSAAFTTCRQTLVPIAPTAPSSEPPPGMVEIPAADYDFAVNGIEVENGNDPGQDVQYPWEPLPRRFHRHHVAVARFFIDRTPVTNAEFKAFLDATHYSPADSHNFLRDWKGGTFPEGWAGKPVTWVSLEDARAYATWAGKRLPHVWEWQYAAQGGDGRIYPWGPAWNSRAVPPPDHSRTGRPPTDVTAFPAGASPFGVLDMIGNVEQWTDEFQDEHTRAAVLRGGDFYRPLGSMWYFPKSYRLDEEEKYLLIAPSRDRSAVVGFRCVKDAVPRS